MAQTESQRKWYVKNAEKVRKKFNDQYHERRPKIFLDRGWTHCAECGQDFPPHMMNIDHIDPSTKSFDVGSKIATHSLEEGSRLNLELDKCQPLCQGPGTNNCHEKKTFGEDYDTLMQKRRTGLSRREMAKQKRRDKINGNF
tara:strand:+ start:168 stop:593 length:426 start_codon:yes stop_codon:yes gene_type:complete